MKRTARRLCLFIALTFCLQIILLCGLCGCKSHGSFYFLKTQTNTVWECEEGDVSLYVTEDGIFVTITKNGERTDLYLEDEDLHDYYAYVTDATSFYPTLTDDLPFDYASGEQWELMRTHSQNHFTMVTGEENGGKYITPGRVLSFYRNDDHAPLFDYSGREWIRFGERPVDLYHTKWYDASGQTLQVGHTPLIVAQNKTDETEKYLVKYVENGYFLYPLSSEELIGTNAFEKTCLGYWKWFDKSEVAGAEGLKCLDTSGIFERVTEVYDEKSTVNLRIAANMKTEGWLAGTLLLYPNTEWESYATYAYTIEVGDPAAMTGTMTINGESVAATWVMEDYYHSDIVRVYRAADYESETFSAEDSLLCRMKVRCTDEGQDTFVATVVGEGVFPEGTCFTYHIEQ